MLVTVSDKKIGVDGNSDGTIDYYTADVTTANDYYPFGMTMPGRKFSASSSNYRYGFNGKENDNETKTQDYGMRIYNPGLGKFLSVDPLARSFPWYTPYQFAGNKPIEAIDLDGAEEFYVNQQNAIKSFNQILHSEPPKESTAAIARRQFLREEIIVQTGPTTSMVAPRSYFIAREYLYQQAVGENIRGGAFGAGAYLIGGDEASFAGGAVDRALGVAVALKPTSVAPVRSQNAKLSRTPVALSTIGRQSRPPTTISRNILQDIFKIKHLKGNSDIAAGTEVDAISIGIAWVNGPNVRSINIKNGIGFTDGTRTFRLQWKQNSKMWKANFEENTVSATGKVTKIKDVHMVITDKTTAPPAK